MATVPPRSILLVLLGAPFESDMLATLFRLVEEALAQGHAVKVWACGYATTITLRSLGERKPRNLLRLDDDHPSTMRLVRGLLQQHAGQLAWFVCRQCLEERGATEQMAEVTIQAPYRILDYIQRVDVSLVLRGR